MAILVTGAVASVVVQAESEPAAPKALAEAAIAVVEFAAKAVISIA